MAKRAVRAADLVGGIDVRSDTDLAAQAVAGAEDAFAELYRRHADAAWRVAYAVTGNHDDAADATSEAFTRLLQALPRLAEAGDTAFRPYLLAATRNASIDLLRRGGRLRPTDEVERLDSEASLPTPVDRVLAGVDAALVAQAFRGLPERWRSVLWLTEVEGIPPREAAEMLGLSANGAAQLAVRARAGLRDRFLQAHVSDDAPEGCRSTRERLGAYVGGGLSPRDIAKVDQHLAGCTACKARQEELADLRSTLRRLAMPIPLGLGAVAFRRWRLVASGAEPARRAGALAALTPGHRVLAGASATLFALGLFGAAVVTPGEAGGESSRPRLAAPVTYDESALADAVPVADVEAVADAIVALMADPVAPPEPVAVTIPPPASVAAPDAPAPVAVSADGADSTEWAAPPETPPTTVAAPVVAATPPAPPVRARVGISTGPVDVVIEVELGEVPTVGATVGPVAVGEPTTPNEPSDQPSDQPSAEVSAGVGDVEVSADTADSGGAPIDATIAGVPALPIGLALARRRFKRS